MKKGQRIAAAPDSVMQEKRTFKGEGSSPKCGGGPLLEQKGDFLFVEKK
jgi:hypothetical protein